MKHSIRNYESGIRSLWIFINKRRRGYFVGLMGMMLLINGMAMGQTETSDVKISHSYVSLTPNIDTLPEFPGGIDSLKNFLFRKLQNPIFNKYNVTRPSLYFYITIKSDGSVSDVQIRDNGFNNDDFKKVVESMPKWIPGKQKGKNVPVRLCIPFYIK